MTSRKRWESRCEQLAGRQRPNWHSICAIFPRRNLNLFFFPRSIELLVHYAVISALFLLVIFIAHMELYISEAGRIEGVPEDTWQACRRWRDTRSQCDIITSHLVLELDRLDFAPLFRKCVDFSLVLFWEKSNNNKTVSYRKAKPKQTLWWQNNKSIKVKLRNDKAEWWPPAFRFHRQTHRLAWLGLSSDWLQNKPSENLVA